MRRVYCQYSKENDIVERSKRLVVAVVCLISSLPPGSVRFSVGDQVIRSAGAIGSNLTEARINRSKKDFLSSATIALKEANETIYWLDILQKLEMVDNDRLEELLSESEQITRIIASMIKKVRDTL